jgi:hypothetical protein
VGAETGGCRSERRFRVLAKRAVARRGQTPGDCVLDRVDLVGSRVSDDAAEVKGVEIGVVRQAQT